MLLSEGGQVLAGSAVNYRRLKAPDGRTALVGIMTGSWTLPAARGKGAFTQIIDESVRLTREHGGAALLAFVTETNASYRRLEAAGSTLFDTRYVSSKAGVQGAAPREAWRALTPSEAAGQYERFLRARPTGARFEYSDAAAWAGQLLNRPAGTSVIEVEALGCAVVEAHGDFDRLQALAPTEPGRRAQLVRFFLERAQAAGRRLFLFESSVARANELVALGMDAAPGFLTYLPGAQEAHAELLGGRPAAEALATWALDSGDRM
jgi:hypothetical protein